MRIPVLLYVVLLSGCIQYGQSVMISSGKAGTVQRFFGADAEFCKMTATEGYEITDKDRDLFAEKCPNERARLIEILSQ